MLLALLNSLFRLLLDLLVVRCRSEAGLQSEILLLRHQLRVLQRQTRRPRWQPGDRLLLAALSCRLPGSLRSLIYLGAAASAARPASGA